MHRPIAADTVGATDPRSAGFIAALAALLRRGGLIDDLALKRAERAQAQSGERFDVVLVRLGLVGEAAMAAVLAEHLGLRLAGPGDLPRRAVGGERIQAKFLAANRMLPIGETDGALVVAMADPLNNDAIEALAYMLERPVVRAVMPAGDVLAAIEALYDKAPVESGSAVAALPAASEEANTDDVRRLEDMASEAPIIRLVNDLIARAVDAHASDIHLEPREDAVRVRLRIDGALTTIEHLPPSVRAAVASRIKIMARANITEQRLPQDGRLKATVRGREIDLRLSTMPTLHGESIVLRILDRGSVQLDFGGLGFGGPLLARFITLLDEPNGIILVTGPTGSGKTTTLYTALQRLNSAERKTFTVEDPVEYQLAGVNQIQVQPKIGLTFATALRSILRQDPDIVMVGEIRDLETAEIAIQASLTGHLVLSTVHTNSAAATVTRLLNMGVADYLLGSSLAGVLAQRLVRRLCPKCRAPAAASPALAETLKRHGLIAGKSLDLSGLRRKTGCEDCRGTGYAGRTTVAELMVVDERVRDCLLAEPSDRALEAAAIAGGMTTLFQDGLAKALAGETTMEEVLRVSRAA